ncbi:MAG: histidine triad nucleotide-binding protein [Clostridia bacterium]|nr:histidine triad nucleotide-binding protein [Clostridia bacterium]MEE1024379.1 histidine triad nucleotide-binding protein [Acutalibacteraceae bacterium]
MDCLFCKIIEGSIPSTKIYEDEKVYAFADINPQAPFHALIVPKMHIESAADITAENSDIVKAVFEAAAIIAKENSLNNGFRIVTNSGEYGCQSVKHIHFHLLSGKQLSESMA